jgi:hypothetical protein
MSTPQDMMKLGEILIAHCRAGTTETLWAEHYSPDAVSVEAAPMPGGSAESVGIEAIRGKNDWWNSAHEIHEQVIEGPFVHGGSRFHVIFDLDVTDKASGSRTRMREVATYHVENGKIVREEFAYAM